MAFTDFLRRIGLLPRHKDPVGGAERGRRQPGDVTVALGRTGAAPRAEDGRSRGPALSSSEPDSTEATVITRRGPARPAATIPHPPAASEPAARTPAPVEAASRPAAPPVASGVDPLATTRVVTPPGEEPVGRVVGVLVAVEGELEGSVFPVVSGNNRLGRHPECEVTLASEWISRHHARIEYKHGLFVIEASSDKPTLVNSDPIRGRELQDGDFVKLGKTTLRFRTVL